MQHTWFNILFFMETNKYKVSRLQNRDKVHVYKLKVTKKTKRKKEFSINLPIIKGVEKQL